jgi:hypothetical protein
LDEQKRMVEYYENQKIEQEREREREHEERRSEAAEEDSAGDSSNQKEETLVEVAPGMSLPLRSIEETYKSIVIGKTVSAKVFWLLSKPTCH